LNLLLDQGSREDQLPVQFVMNARHDKLAAEVNYRGLRADELCDFGVGLYLDEPVVLDGNGLGPFAGLIDCVDLILPSRRAGRSTCLP
jgi:hypothetical protein